VDDSLLVRELKRVTHLRDNRERVDRREVPAAEHFPQVHAVHELHEEVVQPARLAEVVDGHDVRVAEPRQRAGLADESFLEAGVAVDARWKDLERDEPVEPALACLVDRPHPAASEQFQDFELWKEPREFRGLWEARPELPRPELPRRRGRRHGRRLGEAARKSRRPAEALFQKASRAKALRDLRADRRPAPPACPGFRHGRCPRSRDHFAWFPKAGDGKAYSSGSSFTCQVEDPVQQCVRKEECQLVAQPDEQGVHGRHQPLTLRLQQDSDGTD
jgi:hypothetical protein